MQTYVDVSIYWLAYHLKLCLCKYMFSCNFNREQQTTETCSRAMYPAKNHCKDSMRRNQIISAHFEAIYTLRLHVYWMVQYTTMPAGQSM